MLTLASLAIDMLSQVSATRTRDGGEGEWVDGHWVPGGSITATITIAEQPVSGNDLERLPEGERTEEMRTVYTKADLRTASEPNQTEADILTFAGSAWKVIRVFPRQEGGFTKAIVSRANA